jgi:hypothetical protein
MKSGKDDAVRPTLCPCKHVDALPGRADVPAIEEFSRRSEAGLGPVSALLGLMGAAGAKSPLTQSPGSRRQRLHLGVEIGLSLEADARQIGHGDVTVLDAHAVGKAAIGLEQIRIALIAAKPEPGRDVQ